jgi:hypothetical protein
MTVTITAAAGGTWSTVVGKNYTVQSSGLSGSAIPIDLDCSELGPLSSMTLTYTGSMNYINFLRNMSWATPLQEYYTNYMYTVAGKYGGGGGSQLDVATPVTTGSAWSMAAPDIYGYFAVATSTASTIAGTTLTLGGTVSGRYQVGQTVIGMGIGQGITITGVLSGNGTRAGDTLSLSSSPGTISKGEAINGTIVGMFPSYKGAQQYNNAHGGFLLKRDFDPAANDSSPAFLACAV